MATVSAVYTTDTLERTPEEIVSEVSCAIAKTKRPRPEQKRVWSSIEKSAEQVIGDAFDEASHRDPNEEKHWVALVDSNNTQLDILNRMGREKGVDITVIVDIIHVIDVWKAGRVFHPKFGPELENWVRHRLLGVLKGKAGLMAGGMRRSATRKKLGDEPVDACATYLLNKSP